MTYSSKTPCPDRVLPSTTVWFFSARDEAKSSHSTLHTSHCTLRTPNFKLHTPHFTLHTSHFSLLPSHSKPHTSSTPEQKNFIFDAKINRISTPEQKNFIFEAFLIKNLNRKWKQPKSERIQLQQVHAAITMLLATIPSKTQAFETGGCFSS